MSKDDWSIVVGIKRYPTFPRLKGPENDAMAFNDWLLDKAGGDVPKEQITLILSSHFPEAAHVSKEEPTEERIDLAFRRFVDLSDESIANGRGPRVGRRLYVYMAGHGLQIEQFEERFAVLLTANATKSVPAHVYPKAWVEHLRLSGAFDQTVLLLDACREPLTNVPPNRPIIVGRWVDPVPRGARWLIGHASQDRRTAYEKPFGPDEERDVHAIFSRALLAGLRGAAPRDTNGNVTAATLSDYVRENMRELLSADEKTRWDVNTEPQMDPGGDGELILASFPRAEFKVEVRVKPDVAGRTVRILASDLRTTVFSKVVAEGEQALTLSLPVGLYSAEVLDGGQAPAPFLVAGLSSEEVTHVVLG